MKKVLLLCGLVALIFFFSSCQKPEEFILSKYFQAMKAHDRDSMASMAIEPIELEFKSWKLISSNEPVEANPVLPDMLAKYRVIEEQRNEQATLANDKRDASKTIEDSLAKARGGRQKADLQKKFEAADAEFKVELEKFKALSAEAKALKDKIDHEKTLIKLSCSIERDPDLLNGKSETIQSLVNITTASGNRDYIFLFRKYKFLNPVSGKLLPSRLIILKIQPKDEFDKATDVSEPIRAE